MGAPAAPGKTISLKEVEGAAGGRRPAPERMRSAALSSGAYWEVRREKVLAAAYTLLLPIAYGCAAALADARPAAEAAADYLSWRHPLYWCGRAMDAVGRAARGLPWWGEALAAAFVGLPLGLAAMAATTAALLLAVVFSLLGRAAEERWVPALAEAWEAR